MKHSLACNECYIIIAELKEEEVGPGHRVIETYPKEKVYIGSDQCEACEWGEEEEE